MVFSFRKAVVQTVVIGIFVFRFCPFATEGGEDSQDKLSHLSTGVDASHFSDLLDHSPFTRIVFLSDSLILTGVARLDGKPVATLMNTEVAESITVSGTPSGRGWKLVDLSGSEDIETAVAVITTKNGDAIKIRYDKERMMSGSQRMKFAAQARSQKVASRTRLQSGNLGNSGIPPERVAMLKRIEQNELPKGYNPGAGKNREDSHNLHQSYVDRRLGGMSERQRGVVGKIWNQKEAVAPGMSNRGASFVRIMEHVAENEER